MKYRLDVQGLRGIAVLAVLIFHAGLFLPGGFLGVDIFFVISGYVVGGLLLSRRFANSWDFWRSRFLRLAPAATVLVVFTVLVFTIFLWSDQYVAVPAVGAAALFSVANMALAVTGEQYFGPTVDANPLLHLWSLSVEEQIYLLLPLLIGLLFRLRGKPVAMQLLRAGIISLGLLSLLLGIFGSSELRGVLGFGEAVFGFYSPVSRLWEFLAGLYLAQRPKPLAKTARGGNVFSVLGLLLVSFALFFYRDVENFSFVFLFAAVSGTFLLIGSPNSSLAKRILSGSTLVWFGNRSYSIYLWHWPFVILAGELWSAGPLALVVATGLSIVPAFFSHRYLEVPFRGFARLDPLVSTNKVKVAASIFLVGSFLVLPTTYLATKDGSFRFLPGNDLVGDVSDDGWFRYLESNFGVCSHPVTGESGKGDGSFHHCLGDIRASAPNIVLVGDSHAAHFLIGVQEAFPGQKVMFLGVPRDHLSDARKLGAYQSFLASGPVSMKVFVSYRWEGYSELPAFSRLFSTESLRSHAEVFVLNGLPTFPMDPVTCKNGYGVFSLAPDCDFSQAEISEGRSLLTAAIEQEVSKLTGASVLDSFGQICQDGVCDMESEGSVLFADRHHLNLTGSREVIDGLGATIQLQTH